ncbi:DUF2163 domain-containing protein [Glaciimonas sp. PCH181]|uniref:DUF2163 domain-containing protein n=1 Tax=Glaciimonas sp. PCH181 TaxID=2133943 RepID=UPI000D3CF834|nr:DUF2163 domain-containing protein [Glaciimonas sp. PCH181]PUA17257.1 hypothetical protein C7W93_15100 [Glaciimonas sp. PCH181]
MKSQVANYATRTLCLRIVPVVGAAVCLTHYPRNLIMSNGAVYLTNSGYEFTGYTAASGTSPAMIDVQGIAGIAGISKAAIASGVFDNARCYLFATNWDNPIEDYEPIVASIFGKTTLTDDKYQIQEMALIDALNQSVGRTYTVTCQKTFGGQEYAGCKIDLGPLTVTGTITSVTSNTQFGDAGRSEAIDYFGAGTIQFTSGKNAGLKRQEIKSFNAGGAIVTYEAFYYTPAVGDTYTMIPGCRKRSADCSDKWHNIINHGGFANIPTGSQYAQIGQAG